MAGTKNVRASQALRCVSFASFQFGSVIEFARGAKASIETVHQSARIRPTGWRVNRLAQADWLARYANASLRSGHLE